LVNNCAASLTVSIGNQTVAMCIDTSLSGDVTLCASRKKSSKFGQVFTTN